MDLTKERQTLQQVKSSILYKAEIAEEEYLREHKGCNESISLYFHAAEIEVHIVGLLKEEDKKFYPNLISAISCYIKSEEYLKAENLLSKHYPRNSKYYSIPIIKELRDKVEDWYYSQPLNNKVINFQNHSAYEEVETYA